jgi:uncharacterized membrane protein YhaH (DUF805 family)
VRSFGSTRRRSRLLWLFLGLRGRISRSVYWLAFVLLRCIQVAILMQILGGEQASWFNLVLSIGPVILLVTLYANIAVSVKRLHDVGYSGLLALALFVPLVDLAFSIWTGILPGTAGANRYGATPDAPPG